MVPTVEPGIYISETLTDVPAEYRSIGIRIEDDVCITETGNRVLTDGVPKGVEEIEALMAHNWPGNVRQLQNVVQSAVIRKEGPTIQPEDLVLPDTKPGSGRSDEWRPEALDEVQRKHILRVLEHTGGNKKRAAEILGIERCTLYSKLKSYGVGAKES